MSNKHKMIANNAMWNSKCTFDLPPPPLTPSLKHPITPLNMLSINNNHRHAKLYWFVFKCKENLFFLSV